MAANSMQPGAPNSGAPIPKNKSANKSARTKAVKEFSSFAFKRGVKNQKKMDAGQDGNWQNGDNKMKNPMPNSTSFKW